MAEDYYDLLGVPRDATTGEIKDAYRDRIKEAHPDVSDDRAASERTKRLIEAKDVLTDDEKRARYDQLGHDQFVNNSETAGEQTGTEGDRSSSNRQQARSHNGTRDASAGEDSSTSRGGATGKAGYRQRRAAQHAGPNWSQSTDGAGTESQHETWGADRSYTVGDGHERFEMRQLFDSQQTIVLLGTTFVIYPILLAGALFPPFPAAANLTIAFCTIMVIAYLQSIPQVGIVVFGIWTVLLPIGLFGGIGLSPFSLYGVLAVAAVLFPFGLSVLTWFAIKPTRQP
jgi:hypothetical protein